MASQNISTLISNICKSRTVLLALMEKQGYMISDYEGFSVNEVNTMKTNNQLDMLLEKKKSDEDTDSLKIYIKYYLGKALKPATLQ